MISEKTAKKYQKNGFTLIEIMVAMFVFSLIVGAVSGLLINSIRAQRNNLTSQILLDQTSYDLEYMSRALRMAIKDLDGSCLGESGLNYKTTPDLSSLKFINHLEGNECQEFFLDNGQLKQKKGSDSPLAMTSPKLQITSLKFVLSGEGQSDKLQPKVTISLKVKGIGQRPEEQPEIIIQTTVSQRNLDIEQ